MGYSMLLMIQKQLAEINKSIHVRNCKFPVMLNTPEQNSSSLPLQSAVTSLETILRERLVECEVEYKRSLRDAAGITHSSTAYFTAECGVGSAGHLQSTCFTERLENACIADTPLFQLGLSRENRYEHASTTPQHASNKSIGDRDDDMMSEYEL